MNFWCLLSPNICVVVAESVGEWYLFHEGCEPCGDTNVSLLFFLWWLFDTWCIFMCSISTTGSTFQFNLWMNRCLHEPSSFTMSRFHWNAYARIDAMVSHMCFSARVILEIICPCYFYTNLSVAFLVYSVVRSLLACLVCCFVCIWFVIQSIEHHPLVISSLPHALFLQPQQVSMHICCTTK
jgi:hypothetical protein